jgi:UDP-N-acetylmuramoyl-tripeptide--D-alanyl-D-alanine ligase
MLELGELAAEMHYEIGREAAAAGIDRLVLVGELTRATAAGALEGGLAVAAVTHVETAEAAVALMQETLMEGDVVLVKGSRRMRLEVIVQELAERWGGGAG